MVTHAILSPESTCQCTITHTGWPPEGSAGPPLQWQRDKKVTVPSLWVMFWKLQWPPSCSWNGIPSLVVALLLHSQNWNSKCWTAEELQNHEHEENKYHHKNSHPCQHNTSMVYQLIYAQKGNTHTHIQSTVIIFSLSLHLYMSTKFISITVFFGGLFRNPTSRFTF